MCLAAVMGILLEWFKSAALFGLDSTTLAGSLMVCILTSIVFSCLLLSAAYGMKIKEITSLLDRVTAKLKFPKK